MSNGAETGIGWLIDLSVCGERKPAGAVASHPPHRWPPLAPAPAQPHPASPRQPCPPPRPSLLQPLFALSGLPAALALASPAGGELTVAVVISIR